MLTSETSLRSLHFAPSMTPPPLPRHLGLSRRQSYDPLSTSSKLSKSLHLGTLPSPQFVHLPAGQRSVPATESSLSAIGGYRVHDSGIGEAKEGPRTPGGSLVIGSEVFGFGTFKGGAGAGGKGASGRWGDGRVGNEESEEQEGREWATNGFENGSGLASPAIGDQEFGLGGTSGKGDSNVSAGIQSHEVGTDEFVRILRSSTSRDRSHIRPSTPMDSRTARGPLHCHRSTISTLSNAPPRLSPSSTLGPSRPLPSLLLPPSLLARDSTLPPTPRTPNRQTAEVGKTREDLRLGTLLPRPRRLPRPPPPTTTSRSVCAT
jgi:hypothetical protein